MAPTGGWHMTFSIAGRCARTGAFGLSISTSNISVGSRCIFARAGIEAGLDAGGENGPVRSAALLVVHEESFPLVDLRVDGADGPIAALRALWTEYIPWLDEFVIRAVDPDRAKGQT